MYVAIVTLEVVVAPIPGTLLHLPGGVIFGGLVGGTLALTGNVIGSGISCVLMRSIVGPRLSDSFFEKGDLQRYEHLIEKHGLWIVLLLRLNPLTSLDLVSYAAGLTRISVSSVILGTLIGLAPLCYLRAYLAQELFTVFPWMIWPVALGGVGYLVVVIIVVRRLSIPTKPLPEGERKASEKADVSSAP